MLTPPTLDVSIVAQSQLQKDTRITTRAKSGAAWRLSRHQRRKKDRIDSVALKYDSMKPFQAPFAHQVVILCEHPNQFLLFLYISFRPFHHFCTTFNVTVGGVSAAEEEE